MNTIYIEGNNCRRTEKPVWVSAGPDTSCWLVLEVPLPRHQKLHLYGLQQPEQIFKISEKKYFGLYASVWTKA